MEALIIIDVQTGLVNRKLFKKDEFLQNINKAIIDNRKVNNRIVFIQHNSKVLKNGSNEWELSSKLDKSKDDIIIQKRHGDAFFNTDLKQYLTVNKIKNIIICGLVSHGCVFYTCKSGLENGFKVKLIKNGHSNWLKDAENKINNVNRELENMGIILI